MIIPPRQPELVGLRAEPEAVPQTYGNRQGRCYRKYGIRKLCNNGIQSFDSRYGAISLAI